LGDVNFEYIPNFKIGQYGKFKGRLLKEAGEVTAAERPSVERTRVSTFGVIGRKLRVSLNSQV
jgi:hypothetical protein